MSIDPIEIEEAERQRLARALGQIVWTSEPDGSVDWASDGFFEYVGTRDIDLRSGSWIDLVHPADRLSTVEAWTSGVRTGTSYAIELRLRRHDGVDRWHLLTAAPVRDVNGAIVRWYGALVDVDDRRVAQEAMRASEARLRAILDSEPECVKLVAADGILLDMNPAGLAMIEADSSDQVVGRNVAELIHPDDRKAFVKFHRSVLTGASGELRFRIVGRRGSTRWVESRSVLLAPTNDQPRSVLSVTRDVTERVRGDLLRDAEGHVLGLLAAGAALDDVLGAIADSLAEISGALTSVHLVDPVGARLRHGAASGLPAAFLAALDGWPPGPKAGSCGTAVHRRQVVIVSDIDVDPLWEDHRELAHEHGLRACWSTPVFSAGGAVVATLAQYYREPREPTKAEQRLSERMARLVSIAVDRVRADEELRASEQRFRTVAAITSDVVWDWDVVNDTVWRTGALSDVLGESDGAALGTPRSWKELVHPDDHDRVDGGFEAAIRGDVDSWSDQYRLLRPDGSVEHVRERATIVRDASGAPVRVVGSSVEITRELELERQLAQSQRLESIGQLTGGIAHDFNNLLTVILGTSEMLHDGLADEPALRSLAATSRDAALRGAELTARLLAFARRQPLDPSAVDVEELLDRLAGLLERTLGEDVELRLELADPLWPALVDPGQLESAVLNLCINARDAMPRGGVLTIETSNIEIDGTAQSQPSELRPGSYVRLAVSDTGEGMLPDVLARAFDPFFTTKPVGAGSGLGLSMVYGFAKQSLGHVSIYSELGEGTTVRLYLPRAGNESAHRPRSTTAEEPARGAECILVVEDDELVREHVSRQLETLGYRVLLAADGAAALDVLARSDDIDLLFTDIVMPGGMNGRELAERARQVAPDLTVLFTSGYAEQALVHDGRLDAGVLLLSKPYRLVQLAAMVRQALGAHATG